MSKPWEQAAAAQTPVVQPQTAQSSAQATQGAAQAAVVDSVANPTQTTQTVVGTTAGMAATTPGALGITAAQNAGFSAVGNMATQTPELPGIAWLVTFAYQGTKNLKFIDQDHHKWFILPLLAFAFGFGLFMLETHGDVFAALAQAIKNCGLAGVCAATNYQTAKPLGIFLPAADIVNT